MKVEITRGDGETRMTFKVGSDGVVIADTPDGEEIMRTIRVGASRDQGDDYLRALVRQFSRSSYIHAVLIEDDGDEVREGREELPFRPHEV